MSTESSRSDDKALEALLERAAPRPQPSADGVARARAAVQDEWQQLMRRRRGRRLRLAAAAAVVAVALLVALTATLPPPPAVQIATVDRASGAIYILGEQSRLERTDALSAVMTGQTIVTGDGAAVGLRWASGGALRVGENTEIAFIAADRVELANGRVYFDSQQASGTEPLLTIGTRHGDVRHAGTQFLTLSSDEELVVHVREGRVDVSGRFHDASASRGEMLRLRGSEPPLRASTLTWGPQWRWIEEVATPATPMHGRTLGEFLAWVQRETGLEIRFEDSEIRAAVMQETMSGDVSDTPRVALRQRLLTFDLSFEEHDGWLLIRALHP